MNNYIPNDLINNIKNKVDIVEVISSYISVKQQGKSFVCLCPFHPDKTPSMHISKEKQIFKCFSCNVAGNVFSFIEKFTNCSFIEAVIIIGKKYNFDLSFIAKKNDKYNDEQKNIFKVNEEAWNYFNYYLTTNSNEIVKKYLAKRQLTFDLCQKFNIGYAPKLEPDSLLKHLQSKGFNIKQIDDAKLLAFNHIHDFFINRLMFSIKDNDNNFVGFSGRSLELKTEYKYINTQDSLVFKKNQVLYNYYNVSKLLQLKQIIIVEGFMDLIALYRIGIENCLATMGVAFSKEHLFLIRKLTNNIILCFDNDEAGQLANLKTGSFLFAHNFNVDIVLPYDKEYKDIDEMVNKTNKVTVNNVISNTLPFIQYKYKILIKDNAKTSPEQIADNIKSILTDICNINDELKVNEYLIWLAKEHNTDVNVFINALQTFKLNKENQKNNSIKKEIFGKYYIAERGILQFLILFPELSIKLFNEKLNFLNNESNDKIAKAILANYISSRKIEQKNILDSLSQNEQEIFAELCENNENIIFDFNALVDYMRVVSEKQYDDLIYKLSAQNNDSKINYAQRLENLEKIKTYKQYRSKKVKEFEEMKVKNNKTK